MAVRRSSGGGKRGFRKYGSPVQAGWSRPGGGGEPGSPYELTMRRVKLSAKLEPHGMDEGRKRNLRRMVWYWQWSRDWNWRQMTTISGAQPERRPYPIQTYTIRPDDTETKIFPAWYWTWPKGRKGKRKKRLDWRRIAAKRGTELMDWMVSLNAPQDDSDQRP